MTEAEAVEFSMDPALYGPVEGPDAPAGPSLAHDPVYADFRAACTSRPERYDPVRGREIPAEPPNWRRAATLGRELLLRTKDVAVLAPVASAETATRGLPGTAEGLHLLRRNLEDFWQELHPVADADGDYFERTVILSALGPALAKLIEGCAIHTSPRAGPITLRTLAIAAGEARATPQDTAFEASQLERLFVEEDGAAEAAATAARAASEARAHLAAIAAFVEAQDGAERVSFSDADRVLTRVVSLVERFAPAEPGAEEPPADGGEPEERPAVARPTAEVTSRGEALALIDEVIAWHARHARSSPVPFVLYKIRGLVDSDFVSLLDAVAPGGGASAALQLGDLDAAVLDGAGGAASAPRDPDAVRNALEAVGRALDDLETALSASPEEGEGGAEQDGSGVAARMALATAREALGRAQSAADSGGQAAAETPHIESRADVATILDKLIKYFAVAEPSSPVAGFLERAKHLVNRGFVDIVDELAPQGRAKAELRLASGGSAGKRSGEG